MITQNTLKNDNKTYLDPETKKFIKGNPGGGRPAGSVSIVSAIKRKLDEMPAGERRTNLEILVDKIIESAKRGNDQQIKNILQYVDGMPKQPIEHSGEIGVKPIYDATMINE